MLLCELKHAKIVRADSSQGVADLVVAQGLEVAAVSLLESQPRRAMDALHVACALAVEPDIFVSADHRQLSAARKTGLKVVDVS